MNSTLSSLALMLCGPCLAQQASAPVAPTLVQDHPTARSEPKVVHSVVEDKGARIDELRVRGQTQYLVVTPKVGAFAPYEIVSDHTGREPADGVGGSNTAVGKRVWKILDF